MDIQTPRWALPLQATRTPTNDIVRYRGAYGGRSSGKSHEFAGMVVEEMVADPECAVVCIREVQKSLALSAKKLIEAKIREFGVAHLFRITKTEISRIGGSGICVFQGMQDHTAESVKSLEGFHIAWVEEAESLSEFSMSLLIPTIRSPRPWAGRDAEVWFTWNPKRRTAPVELLLRRKKRTNAIVVRVNYTDNPFLPRAMAVEAAEMKLLDLDSYSHIWLGDYESIGANVVVPLAWFNSAVGLAQDLGIDVSGQHYGALEVAGAEDGGDENAFAHRYGIELRSVESWNGLDTSETTNKAVELATTYGIDEVYYDSVSVGEGVTGEWASMGRRDEQPAGMVLHPWSGGSSVIRPDEKIDPDDPRSKTNKEQYQNLKAQAHFALRKRFENAHKARLGRPYDADMLISIPRSLPNLLQLEEEITQPQHKASGTGKTMVDKQPNGTSSPNLGDSVVMAYFPVASSIYSLTGVF